MNTKVKEITLRPRTEIHDLTYKTKHAREFLDAGHRVKLTVRFKGREQAHPEYGTKVLEQAIGLIPGDFGVGPIKHDGRLMTVELRPGKS